MSSSDPDGPEFDASQDLFDDLENIEKQTVRDTTIYALSRTVDGKPTKIPMDDMVQNVKALVRDAFRNERRHDADSAVPLIVGQNIRHCQLVNGERVWFNGKIISQVPGYPMWYNVKYIGDEAIYSYRLMDDYIQGDLTIVL